MKGPLSVPKENVAADRLLAIEISVFEMDRFEGKRNSPAPLLEKQEQCQRIGAAAEGTVDCFSRQQPSDLIRQFRSVTGLS